MKSKQPELNICLPFTCYSAFQVAGIPCDLADSLQIKGQISLLSILSFSWGGGGWGIHRQNNLGNQFERLLLEVLM